MEAQRNELIALAAEKGWNAVRIDNFSAADWSVETWELESFWSPVGVKAFVTFPIDEQLYPERRPWAIRVSSEHPTDGPAPGKVFQTSLIQWKNDKPRFIDFLDQIRLSK